MYLNNIFEVNAQSLWINKGPIVKNFYHHTDTANLSTPSSQFPHQHRK